MKKRLKIIKWGSSDGMVLISTILGMLLFGVLGTSMIYVTANNLSSSTEDLEGSQSFHVAEGGMQYVLQNQLNGDTNFSDNVSPTDPPFGANAISLSPGQFWVEYLNQQSSSTTVRVTARVNNAVRVVEVSAAQGGSGYEYVTVADGNINMNDSSGAIYGDVALDGTANIDPDVVIYGNLAENEDIEVPTIDFSTYQDMTTSTYNGNMGLRVNYTGNLYVTGNCTIYANVIITGLLYCGGNLTINGNNVVVNGTLVADGNFSANGLSGLQLLAQAPDAQTHMPAVLADGNISIMNSDSMVVQGVMWSDGNIDMTNSDNMQYTGSFMSGGNIILNTANNILLTFDADLLVGVPGLSGIDGGQTGSLSLSGWKTYAPWW